MRTGIVTQTLRLVSRRQFARGFRTNQGAFMAPIKAGDSLPNVDLYEGNPGNKVNTKDAFGKGKHLIVGIPGAFTPTCTNDHMPTFVKDFDKIKAKGVDSVSCVSVNDPFVMEAFGKHMGASGKVRFLADTCGKFTKAVDLPLDVTELLGNVRCQRFAIVVKDGKVTGVQVEPDSSKATCSRSQDVMKIL